MPLRPILLLATLGGLGLCRLAPWEARGASAPDVAPDEGAPVAQEPDASRVLDARTFAYLEDEAPLPGARPRSLAGIDATLAREDGGARLRLVARAEGGDVDPPPGYEHYAGTNAITARELARVLDGTDDLVVATRGPDGARVGTFRAGRRGHLPVRRVLPEGRFALRAPSAEEVPLELVVDSGPLGPGHHRTELRLGGEVRLWVELEVTTAGGRITGVGTPGPSTPEGDLR